jgi:predicted CoA-binding protein
MKKTVVLVASPNPMRFSHKMVKSLIRHGYEPVPVGFRDGVINDIKILKGKPEIMDVHTVSLYLGPRNQPEFYDYIISLKPKRIIFNPGTYNPDLIKLAEENNIQSIIECALIMLGKGNY